MVQPASGGRIPATLAVVAGILAAVGSALAWAQASVGPASFSAAGIDGWEGKATLVGGVVLLVGGVSAFLGVAGSAARLRWSAFVGGLLAAGVGVSTALTARDQIVDSAAGELSGQLGISVAEARSTLEASLDEGVLSLSLQVGIWLVIAGGAIGVAAGVWAMASRRDIRAVPVQAQAGAGLTGWASPTTEVVPPPAPPGETLPTPSVWATPPPPSEDVGSDRDVEGAEAVEGAQRAEGDPEIPEEP